MLNYVYGLFWIYSQFPLAYTVSPLHVSQENLVLTKRKHCGTLGKSLVSRRKQHIDQQIFCNVKMKREVRMLGFLFATINVTSLIIPIGQHCVSLEEHKHHGA